MAQMSWLCSLVLREWGATTEIFAIDGKFTKPMFLGDTITCTGIVTELHPLGPGRDYVVIAATAYNGDGETVGVSTLSVRKPQWKGGRWPRSRSTASGCSPSARGASSRRTASSCASSRF